MSQIQTTRTPTMGMTMKSNKIDETMSDEILGKIFLSLAIFLALINLACANSRIIESGMPSPTPVSSATPVREIDDLEDNLGSVQRMGFDFVYVFTRKDGDVFTSEDKTFLKNNAPADTNQWRLTKDEKTVIAATNYKFSPEHLTALQKRFNVEDRSPQQEENANANTNANK